MALAPTAWYLNKMPHDGVGNTWFILYSFISYAKLLVPLPYPNSPVLKESKNGLCRVISLILVGAIYSITPFPPSFDPQMFGMLALDYYWCSPYYFWTKNLR